MFSTVLVANRGEIAIRVCTTLSRMGIRSVAVFTDADSDARHVAEADGGVGLPDVPGPGVRVGVDGDAADAEPAQGADDPDGDLAAVGDEHGVEHIHIRKTP